MVDRITRTKLKVCIVGDRGVGKTSLLHRYVLDSFSPNYNATLGSNMRLARFEAVVGDDHLFETEVAFFDLMGETGVRDRFKQMMFWGTNGFLAVADMTRPDTIRSLADWIRSVQSVAGNVPFRIVINKVDLADGGRISPASTAALLDLFSGASYSLASAKTGEGIEIAFESLIDDMIGVTLEKSRSRRESRVIGLRILGMAERRGMIGVGKGEILVALKGVDHNLVMQEIDDLGRLGLIAFELSGPAAFRVRLTERGRSALETGFLDGRIIEVSGR